MTTKGTIPEALRNLSISDTRDLMTGVADIKAGRDAARNDLAILQGHLDAANAAHLECEEELAALKAAIAEHLPQYVPENDPDDHCSPIENVELAGDFLKRAERARDEVGIQLAAAQAEIARMRPVVDAARRIDGIRNGDVTEEMRAITDALARLDAVPGDALVCACPDCVTRRSAGLDVRHGATDTLRARVAELEGLLREARKEVDAGIRARELLDGEGSHIERAKVIKHEITRALEASGIDTSNVKDGEG